MDTLVYILWYIIITVFVYILIRISLERSDNSVKESDITIAGVLAIIWPLFFAGYVLAKVVEFVLSIVFYFLDALYNALVNRK